MTITRHYWIALALILFFGLIGAGLYSLGEDGKWLSTFCVIPPLGYYLAVSIKNQSE